MTDDTMNARVEATPSHPWSDYTPEQVAKLAFVVHYSPNLCAPQNIDGVIKEIDTCGNDCEYSNGQFCNKEQRGDYCPFSLAEDLRNISLALYGPRDPSGYTGAVWGPPPASDAVAQAPQQPVAWECYRPGAGSESSTTTLTRFKRDADGARASGATVTPLYAPPPREENVQRLVAAARREALKDAAKAVRDARRQLGQAGGVGIAGASNAQMEMAVVGPFLDIVEDAIRSLIQSQPSQEGK